MNLQNPKNGSKLHSRDFANPPNRYLQARQKQRDYLDNFLNLMTDETKIKKHQ